MKLSSRQLMILDYIKKEVITKGYPPSVREIAEGVGLASGSTVMGHLKKLKIGGLVTWEENKTRTLRVVQQ